MTGQRAKEPDVYALLGDGLRVTFRQVDVVSGAPGGACAIESIATPPDIDACGYGVMSIGRWANPSLRGTFMLPPSHAQGAQNVL